MITVTAKNEFFFREPRLNRVIVLSDLNYFWPKRHLKVLRDLKNRGFSVKEITPYFFRDPDEIFLALLHIELCWKNQYETPVITILENLDFIWDLHELKELQYMWRKGYSVNYASDYFERPVEEIVLAIMHLSREEKIARRKGGLF